MDTYSLVTSSSFVFEGREEEDALEERFSVSL